MSAQGNRARTIHVISIYAQNKLFRSRRISRMLSAFRCSAEVLEFVIFVQISINFLALKVLKIKEW